MSNPNILVVMALRNGQQWVERQMESIINQEGVNVSVVVGDDCSSDNSVEFIEKRFRRDNKVRVIRWDAPSGSAGANFRKLIACCDYQEFDFVAFSDQDDVWLPDKLKVATRAIVSRGVSGYSSAVIAQWPDGVEKMVRQSEKQRSLDFIFEGAGQGCTYVFRAAFARQVADFITAEPEIVAKCHYHDWLVYILARTWGAGWIIDKTPSMLYRQHENNEIGARGGWGGAIKRIHLIRAGWYKAQISAAISVSNAATRGGENFARPNLDFFSEEDSVARRVKLALVGFIHGRRRFVDRVILVLIAIFGFI